MADWPIMLISIRISFPPKFILPHTVLFLWSPFKMPNLYGFFLIIVIAVLGSTPAKGAKSEVEIANEKSAKVFRSKVQPIWSQAPPAKLGTMC
jgi:hypothetical protein